MHEVSLMYEIIQTVQNTAKEHDINKVTSIELTIGDQLSILPEALFFAFECLKKGTILKDSIIKWEISPGHEFYLAYIEGE
ncbi:hydrogenase maturation nickel metallochaperone HypA/HybF [Paenibacillus sp. SEL3]